MVRRLGFLALLVVLCVAARFSGENSQGSVSGVWQGKIQVGGIEERIVLHVAGGTATLDSPDTGKLGTPLEHIASDDTTLAFDIGEQKAAFRGKLSADGTAITGTWTQAGQGSPLTLARLTSAPDFQRDGSYLFQSHCRSCHAPFNPVRAPWPPTLRLMQRSFILTTI